MRSPSHLTLILAVLCLLSGASCATRPDGELAKALRDLTDPDASLRDEAAERLTRAGSRALVVLQASIAARGVSGTGDVVEGLYAHILERTPMRDLGDSRSLIEDKLRQLSGGRGTESSLGERLARALHDIHPVQHAMTLDWAARRRGDGECFAIILLCQLDDADSWRMLEDSFSRGTSETRSLLLSQSLGSTNRTARRLRGRALADPSQGVRRWAVESLLHTSSFHAFEYAAILSMFPDTLLNTKIADWVMRNPHVSALPVMIAYLDYRDTSIIDPGSFPNLAGMRKEQAEEFLAEERRARERAVRENARRVILGLLEDQVASPFADSLTLAHDLRKWWSQFAHRVSWDSRQRKYALDCGDARGILLEGE